MADNDDRRLELVEGDGLPLTDGGQPILPRPPRMPRGAYIAIALIALLIVAQFVTARVYADASRDRETGLVEATAILTCLVEKQGEFQAAVGEALESPPAPNENRDRAVAHIDAAARALRHRCVPAADRP